MVRDAVEDAEPVGIQPRVRMREQLVLGLAQFHRELSQVLYSYGLCSYGLYSYGLYSYGLYSYGLAVYRLVGFTQRTVCVSSLNERP